MIPPWLEAVLVAHPAHELDISHDREVLGEAILAKLKRHVQLCPIGWHQGTLRFHRHTTPQNVIEWVLELERLVGLEVPEHVKTRLPLPHGIWDDQP